MFDKLSNEERRMAELWEDREPKFAAPCNRPVKGDNNDDLYRLACAAEPFIEPEPDVPLVENEYGGRGNPVPKYKFSVWEKLFG